MLAAFCLLSGVAAVAFPRPADAAGALTLCVLSTGALLVLHGYPTLGGSLAFLLVMSALFLLFVQLALNINDDDDKRRFSPRGTFAAMAAAFFGAAVAGTWWPFLSTTDATLDAKIDASLVVNPLISTTKEAVDVETWQHVLFEGAHIEVAVLSVMALCTVLITFLLIRRNP